MPCGLHGLWKPEWNHIFSPNLFLNAKYAYYGWGYGFAPRGGADKDGGVDYDARPGLRVVRGLHRPQAVAHRQRDGNYFKSGMGGKHEFKFGFGYRKHPARPPRPCSGNQIVARQQRRRRLRAPRSRVSAT